MISRRSSRKNCNGRCLSHRSTFTFPRIAKDKKEYIIPVENVNRYTEKFGNYGQLLYYYRRETPCDCTLVKCKNYKLCKTECRQIDLNHKGLCSDCDDYFKKPLHFTGITEECAVCFHTDEMVKVPTDCGHALCVKCIEQIWTCRQLDYDSYSDEDEEIQAELQAYCEHEDRKCCPLCREVEISY